MANYIFARNCKLEGIKHKIGDEVPSTGIKGKEFQFLLTTGTIKPVDTEKKVEKDFKALNKTLSTQLNKSEQEKQVLTDEAKALGEEKQALIEENSILKEEKQALIEENEELKKNIEKE